jgi:hypothetical protein
LGFQHVARIKSDCYRPDHTVIKAKLNRGLMRSPWRNIPLASFFYGQDPP